MKRLKLLVLAGMISTGLNAQDKVKGFVYQDDNGNGKFDKKENGIARVAVSNGTAVIQTDDKGHYELPIGDSTKAGIYANFFMGHSTSKVECRVNNEKWVKMIPVNAADPAYVAELHPWDTSNELLPGRRPTTAVNSPHLWQTAISTDLPTGSHQIEIRATDNYGRTFSQKNTYRIEKSKEHQ